MSTYHTVRVAGNTANELSASGVKQVLMSYRGRKLAAVDPDWKPRPGMLYTQVRAISARVNQNYDAWPSEELKKSYRTFLGKPVFVNHNNDDPDRARGKVIAARYVEAGDDKYVEVIQEIDAERFPKLAREIREGGLDSVSMGVEAGLTKCSYCGNTATDEPEFCDHVKYHKGEYLPRKNTKTGKVEDVLVYETCRKLGFFELSMVFDPADETAVVSRVIAAGKKTGSDVPNYRHTDDEDLLSFYHDHQAGDWNPPQEWVEALHREMKSRGHLAGRQNRRQAYEAWDSYDPDYKEKPPGKIRQRIKDIFDPDNLLDDLERDQKLKDFRDKYRTHRELTHVAYGEKTAPESVDTLRDEDGDTYDDYQFVEPVEEADEPFEHWIESPDELRAPDLSTTQRLDREQEDEGLDADRRVEDIEDIVSNEADMAQPQQGRQAMARRRRTAADETSSAREIFEEMDEDKDNFFDSIDSMSRNRPKKKSNRRTAVEVPDELVDHLTEDLEVLESYAEGGDEGYEDEGMEALEEALGQDLDGDQEYGEDPEHAEAVMGGGDPMVAMAGRRPVEPSPSVRNVRKAKKGTTMASTLSSRGKVASRRRHYADDSGHVDGGPYGNDSDQGNLEEVYISQVPPAEAVEAPADDESNISNTEQTLVARRLQREIQARAADLQRYLTAYRRVAGDNIEEPSEVNPKQSGTDEDLRGDFESLQPETVTTQPKDASVRVFRAFDNWLQSTTGRTASQHGNANFIRRQAASYTKAAGIPLEKMFPALDVVLRQARKAERSAMNRRRAEFDGDVVAPDARIDVETPVENVTDPDAQASQYDSGDFGNNAGDGVAKPNTETDSQIWAPKEANRKADAVAAVRYAEAYINAGLPCEDKWKLVAQAQTIRHATVVDRTRLLEYVAQTNADRAHTQKVAAVVSRGTNNGIPKGLTAPRPTTQRTAAADSADDFGLWF